MNVFSRCTLPVIVLVCMAFAMLFSLQAQTNFPKSVVERMQAPNVVTAQGSPFCDIERVICPTDSNWGRPANFITSGIYCTRYSLLKIKLTDSDTLTIPIDSLTGWPFAVDSIYWSGSDTNSLKGAVYIVGNKKYR
jgi:hypothetical protein